MFVQKLSNLKRFVLAAAAVLLVAVSAYAQNVTVKGTVTDKNNEPVIGAGVLIKGTNNGVSTDIDGQYTITVPRNATLRFTGLNYKEQEIPVNGRAVINVILEDSQLRPGRSHSRVRYETCRPLRRCRGSECQSLGYRRVRS